MDFDIALEFAPKLILRKLERLKFLRENPKYHPERSANEHIRIVYDRCESVVDEECSHNSILRLASIMHDICKLDVVKENDLGYPTCPDHEGSASKLMNKLWGTSDYQRWCSILGIRNVFEHQAAQDIVRYHMAIKTYGEFGKKKKDDYLKLWKRTSILRNLLIFCAADNMLVEFDPTNLKKSWKFDPNLIENQDQIFWNLYQIK